MKSLNSIDPTVFNFDRYKLLKICEHFRSQGYSFSGS